MSYPFEWCLEGFIGYYVNVEGGLLMISLLPVFNQSLHEIKFESMDITITIQLKYMDILASKYKMYNIKKTQ